MHGFIPLDQQSVTQNALRQDRGRADRHCFASVHHKKGPLELWMDSPTPDLLPTPEELVAAYSRRGVHAFDTGNTGAVVVLYNHNSDVTQIAIDAMGIETLSFASADDGIYFSNRTSELVQHLASKTVARQQIFDYLFFHMIPAPGSIFPEITKLLPGHYLEIKNGRSEVKRYWKATFSDRQLNKEQAGVELRSILARSVKRMSANKLTGAFLSGGLDSSTVAGFLSEIYKPAETFSIGFGVDGYDELEFARIANTHFGMQGHELIAKPKHILENFSKIAQAYDEPFGNSSVVPTLLCAQLAKANGIERLLAGDGGDELFAGNERYAKQKVFELYNRLPSPLRRHIVEPLTKLIGTDSSITVLRKAKSYVDQASISLPRRFESWNYAYREGVGTILDPDFAKSIDIESPMEKMETVFGAIATPDLVNKMLVYDWKFTLADNDLRKVSRMCELAGVEVAFPMLDLELVKFSASIPAHEKLKGQRLRAFFKDSMSGFLPPKILSKQKHGFGLPFGVWMKEDKDLAEMIYARLEGMKRRGIFQDGFLEQLINEQKKGDASYFGYFIWDLAMLEEWLTVHELSV